MPTTTLTIAQPTATIPSCTPGPSVSAALISVHLVILVTSPVQNIFAALAQDTRTMHDAEYIELVAVVTVATIHELVNSGESRDLLGKCVARASMPPPVKVPRWNPVDLHRKSKNGSPRSAGLLPGFS